MLSELFKQPQILMSCGASSGSNLVISRNNCVRQTYQYACHSLDHRQHFPPCSELERVNIIGLGGHILSVLPVKATTDMSVSGCHWMPMKLHYTVSITISCDRIEEEWSVITCPPALGSFCHDL